jgi:hypothetical protein
MRRTYDRLTLFASATKTASGTGSAFDVGTYDQGVFFLEVTAASGTSPTLDVDIQTYDIVGGDWHTLVSFTQAIGTGKEMKTSGYLGEQIRINYTIGGTDPSFTFSVGAIVKS